MNKEETIYEVMFFWDPSKELQNFRQYASETLCNVLDYTPGLAVKLVYEAIDQKYSNIFSTRNIDKATTVRNLLRSQGLNCKILPYRFTTCCSQHKT